MLNPDGHVYQEETQGRPGWRKNRRAEGDHVVGVDLNRNYTFQWGFDDRGSSPEPLSETYRGRSALSEPESQALARLVERQSFTIALSYHSFGELLLYPWGYTRDVKAPDHDVYVALAEKMVRDNGYRPGNAFSGAIYLTNGVWDDYMYGETRGAKSTPTFAFTVELNSLQDGGFWPPDGLIQPTCDRLLSLNMYTLEVAADVYAATPPRAPVLSATQDESDGRIIHLRWQQPGDAGRIDHYEVFEIDPVGSPSAWKQARAARLERSGRTILAQGVRVSDSGRLALRLEAALEPLWDYAYVEVRAAGTNSWTSLSGDGTRHDSPTRRNDGHGLTGFLEPRVRVFDAGVYASRRVDVAVRLDAYGDTPTAPRLTASVDVPETITEERRVIDPEVHETFYDVVAERPGLFAYGVTAVDLEGQRTDSDIFWFMIPEPTAVELQDVALEHSDETARLRWTILSDTPARFEVWSRPLSAHEVPASAGAEWGQHAYERVAQRVVSRPGDTSLAWETRPGRHAVLLAAMDPDGPRLWGPWVVQRAARTRLAAARPNPFNPSTILRYETASSTRVVFDIVSVDGQHIRRLVAADVPAGTHTARWDGRDDAGRGVASGVYVARLQADGVVLTRRLVLLR